MLRIASQNLLEHGVDSMAVWMYLLSANPSICKINYATQLTHRLTLVAASVIVGRVAACDYSNRNCQRLRICVHDGFCRAHSSLRLLYHDGCRLEGPAFIVMLWAQEPSNGNILCGAAMTARHELHHCRTCIWRNCDLPQVLSPLR